MYQAWQYPAFVLHDLAAVTCMTVVLATARGFQERKRRLTVAVYALSAGMAALNIALLPHMISATDFDSGMLLYGFVSLTNVVVFPQIILRSSRRLGSALICLALNIGMEGLFSVAGYLLNGVSVYDYHFYETVFCTAGYALVTLFLLFASKNRDLTIIRNTVDLIPKWLYAVIMICSFSSFFSIRGNAPELYSFEAVSGVLHVLSVFGILLFAGYFVFRVFALMARQNQVLMQMNIQQQNYERLLKSDAQLRQFRHDWKNHMIVVTSLLNAGKTDEAAAYLNKVNLDSGIAEKRFLTGNLVVDAILNKWAAARENNVELSFSGVVPEKGVAGADLCTVVGNIVDNALEGVNSFPGERYVRLKGSVRNGYFTLSAVNPVAQRVPVKNNRIRTTKGDAANHGSG